MTSYECFHLQAEEAPWFGYTSPQIVCKLSSSSNRSCPMFATTFPHPTPLSSRMILFSEHRSSSTRQSLAATRRPFASRGQMSRAGRGRGKMSAPSNVPDRQTLLGSEPLSYLWNRCPCRSKEMEMGGQQKTHPLLGQLPSALVLAVAEEFDDTTFVGCESMPSGKRGRKN